MEITNELIYILLFGLGTGLIGGYAGIGGAPILIFLLTYFLNYSQHLAQGTVLAMMLGPMTLFAVYQSWDLIIDRLNMIIICVLTYAVTSYYGAQIAYKFTSPDLQKYFGIILILTGIFYASNLSSKYENNKKIFNPNLLSIGILGSFVGFIGGVFGIGAGILLVPAFTLLFGIKQNQARIMSLAILLPPVSIGAVVQYGLFRNDINWKFSMILLVSYMITNGLGSKIGNKHSPKTLKRALGIILMISGLLLLK